MEIIQQRERKEGKEHRREFNYTDSPGAGCSFDCDENGNLDWAELSDKPAALANLCKCLQGLMDGTMVDMGVQTRRWEYYTDRIGKCRCGSEVYLDRFTNVCDGCESLYNQSGQELSDPSNWGWETGEHPSECW